MVLKQRRLVRAAFFLAKITNALQPKQLVLDLQSASVAAQRTAGGDHSMAGNDDGDGIVMIGLAHGPERSRAAHLLGNFCIGARLAVRDRQQGVPTFFLELGANKIQLAGKRMQLSLKIGPKLLLVREELLWRLDPEFIFAALLRKLAPIKEQKTQSLISGRQQQPACRRIHT